MADEARCNRGLQTTTIDKSLLPWGANNCGQLGQNHRDDQLVPSNSAVAVPSWSAADDIRHVAGGGGFSILLTESGKLFTCGNNDRGQLGHGHREILTVFSPVSHLYQVKVGKVAAGWDFMLGITDSGQLFSWGSNSFGQLGRTMDSGVNHDAVPGEVSSLSQVKQVDIAAGLRHALSVAENGRVYAWGNGKKGQLGSENEEGKPILKACHPVPVKVPDGETTVRIVAGMYHSGILTDSGTIFVWGCNKYGQCGEDPDSTQLQSHPFPCKITISNQNAHLPCADLVSGWTHLVAKTVSCELYTWGRGDLGQLGRPCNKSWDHIPHVVPGVSQVKMHVCGSEHNLALTEDGKVYSWGWNEHGICGTGSEENVLGPIRIPALVDACVTSIGSGAGHSFCSVVNFDTDTHMKSS